MTPAGKLYAELKKHKATHGRDVPFLLAHQRELDTLTRGQAIDTLSPSIRFWYRGEAYLNGRAVECSHPKFTRERERHQPGVVTAGLVGRYSDVVVGIAYGEYGEEYGEG